MHRQIQFVLIDCLMFDVLFVLQPTITGKFYASSTYGVKLSAAG
jgi:hypothetical protein